ncbi:MAG: tetratricopeptide repeat protein [Chloroflexi bacterium]|nr:tetratricopeptide repeat protein [Chloroflexota bacterium]
MRTKLAIFCDKIIEAGWLAAVITVPLYFNIYSARTFEPDKITLLRAIVSLMILAWIILVVEKGLGDSSDDSLSLPDRIRSWLKIPFFLPTALLVLVYIISTIFSLTPVVSLWGSYQRMQGAYSALSYMVVFALIAGNLRTREQVDRLVTTAIVASIPVSLYGIIQKYGLDPLPWAGDVTTRVAANLGNAIFVASYLIMIVPLTLTRLIESMTAIIKDEKASWGHTILAAVYIFALAVQIITIVFSQSRGPMLGMLGASFVIGLLLLLILRQYHSDRVALSVKEIGLGLAFLGPLGFASGLGGAVGFFVGLGLRYLLTALNYQSDSVPLLGAAIGGLLGFFGLYIFMAASDTGWRWLWLSWFGLALVAIVFVVALNLRGAGLDPYLNPIRGLPYVDRLSNVIETEGTGKVRVLIWDAAMKLVAPHPPLGIPGDDEAPPDRFNVIRPLVGYGPESMFNAFAYVYPTELAYVENRGSSADRSHNETMDTLVITGVLGFLAFYFLMITLFYYALSWLGWAPDSAAKRRLIALLILGGISGAVIAYVAAGGMTFMPLGLPFGLVAGVVIHLVWQGFISQSDPVGSKSQNLKESLLFIGLLGALIGHFIEVHFVFSIAATYTYFWVYAGLMLALSKMSDGISQRVSEPAKEAESSEIETAAEATPAEEPAYETRRQRRNRVRKAAVGKKSAVVTHGNGLRGRDSATRPEGWDSWMGSQGLVMAIILIILTFDFITPQFQFDTTNQDSLSLLWMMIITWLVGLAVALSDMAVRRAEISSPVSWGRAVFLYAIISLSYFFFYTLAHQIQFGQRLTVTSVADVVRAADIITNGLLIFYIFLFLLLLLFALTLSWGQTKRLPLWRSENWWLYPPLALAVIAIIWFKNYNVVQADIYLKEGERYRSNSQWNEAIELHKKGLSLDDDEDFYDLMLALDYQLMAQDTRLDPAQRESAWKEGERIALEARQINPYNPDNTGNMGRYYFTLGQVFDKNYFQDALKYFEKAAILAPSNVIYHNLWAQTYYILADYPKAVERLQISVATDPKYPPTSVLLGDTYAAMQNVDEALKAHSQAIKLSSDLFDQFVDQRFNFYLSAGKMENLMSVMQQAAQERPTDAALHWAIGHAYNLQGQPQRAIPYIQQAITLGDTSDRALRELANINLALKQFDQAGPLYQRILQTYPGDIEANSALAFIYAQQGRLDEAIQANQQVLQQKPDDYDSLKNLSILYQQKGQMQEALTAAKQAQAVAPASEAANWEKFISDIENSLAKADGLE